eukprot:2862722-Amphidinium_carterae.1
MAVDAQTPIADGQAEVGTTLGQAGCIAFVFFCNTCVSVALCRHWARYVLPIVLDSLSWSILGKVNRVMHVCQPIPTIPIISPLRMLPGYDSGQRKPSRERAAHSEDLRQSMVARAGSLACYEEVCA